MEDQYYCNNCEQNINNDTEEHNIDCQNHLIDKINDILKTTDIYKLKQFLNNICK
jgi:hypothetical protein